MFNSFIMQSFKFIRFHLLLCAKCTYIAYIKKKATLSVVSKQYTAVHLPYAYCTASIYSQMDKTTSKASFDHYCTASIYSEMDKTYF